jgi:hypothetical protein
MISSLILVSLFLAKPEQENLNELKQELDVDFHKVPEPIIV